MVKYFYKLVLFATVLISLSFTTRVFDQNREPITDFYEYANKDWLDSTVILENTLVVNNWGILWDSIIDKSIEILSGEVEYDLDGDHLYILNQLQNFYESSIQYSDDDIKRVELVQKHYPMLFGIIFSKITVSQRKEEKIKTLIEYLTTAYHKKIKNSDKIGDYYKRLFLSKLDYMEFEIGSPNISSFPKIPILSTDSFNNNIRLSEKYHLDRNIHKTDWESPPYETDCRYSFQDNKVKIYAGTLYDPYFIDEADFVYLFATIGRTIGHEMTHAFDNVGKNYDENGGYINWFEKIFSGAMFSKNNWGNVYDSLINLYSQYTIQDSLFVDGKTTLQENIADIGGIEVSLLALKNYLKDNHPTLSEEEYIGIIRDYFITYAQFWREKATPAFQISSLKRIHTPQKYRAIGPIYNQDDFYIVFEIDLNSKYFIPSNLRVKIW
ncbi:M13-type metalloendopeptidase [Candidatus Neomarinimicrobiota bacterium]